MTTSYIYAFVDTRKNITRDQRIFYVGSTKSTPMQRLRQHLDDMFINDPDREVFKYARNTVGVHNWDMVILRSDIPLTHQFETELEYYHQLGHKGFKLRNSVKPHKSGGTSVNHLPDPLVVSDVEIETAYIYQNVIDTLDNIVEDKIIWAIGSSHGTHTLVDDLLHELKNEIVRSRNLSTTTELVAKNRELQRKNGELTRRDHGRSEMEDMYKEQIATLREFKNHLLGPDVGKPVVQEGSHEVHKVEEGVQTVGEGVQTVGEGVQKHPTRNKSSTVECLQCGKYITRNNIAAHKKKCVHQQNLPIKEIEDKLTKLKIRIPNWQELLNSYEPIGKDKTLRVNCENCGKSISKNNIAIHQNRCLNVSLSHKFKTLSDLVSKLEPYNPGRL